MIVVSDTTAISNLLTVGRADLLVRMFEKVIIPPAVWLELSAFHSEVPEWLEVVEVEDVSRIQSYRRDVHAGEAEAIALAWEIRPDWLLLDDSDGRKLAKAEGLPVLGLIGVLLLARQRGIVSEVRPVLDSLISEAGFYVSQILRNEALRLAGESE